jgi:hypothetical protein
MTAHVENLIAAFAGVALALGIVFWLVSNRKEPQEVEAQGDSSNPTTLNKLQRRRISATDNTNSSSSTSQSHAHESAIPH